MFLNFLSAFILTASSVVISEFHLILLFLSVKWEKCMTIPHVLRGYKMFLFKKSGAKINKHCARKYRISSDIWSKLLNGEQSHLINRIIYFLDQYFACMRNEIIYAFTMISWFVSIAIKPDNVTTSNEIFKELLEFSFFFFFFFF